MSGLLIVGLLSCMGPDPQGILEKVDVASNRANDALITLKVSVSRQDSQPLKRRLRVWQRGATQRMVKFLSPSRLRGTGILVPKKGQTYLYLPAYKRVRRIVGKEGGASFMGTGFSINDLARVQFSIDYLPSLKSETTSSYVLLLRPKEPTAHRHSELKLTVRKVDYLVENIVFLDDKDRVLRKLTATDYKSVGKYTVAHRLEIDEISTGKKTVAVIEDAQFDIGLRANDFTERQLKRSP